MSIVISRVHATLGRLRQGLAIPRNAKILGLYANAQDEIQVVFSFEHTKEKIPMWTLIGYNLPVILDPAFIDLARGQVFWDGRLYILYAPQDTPTDPQPGAAANPQPAKRV